MLSDDHIRVLSIIGTPNLKLSYVPLVTGSIAVWVFDYSDKSTQISVRAIVILRSFRMPEI